ncbi:hypothetical protein AKJ44_00030 [candidate division MSBL1 archaeon SCGC-AAA261F17]|uniref:Translation initiation factor 1A n=1 Tax=candidate division MSBL1 archaeon SCGC-AAA261F17 TaxID=1698274 RepID=A0A133V7W8_9EURY|nr:hypothetical protein AKJ44_00030 [candidate division MSBL1 archaeon SCGC-AAA261F17]
MARLRLPKDNEVLGLVEKTFGSGHLRVRCKDGLTRMCRIPGRMRKRTWIREGDVVIVEPWQVQSDEKADIVYRYTRTQVKWLSQKGIWNE